MATPWTCAWVPSGSCMKELLGSLLSWIMETVPSGLLIVWSTVDCWNWCTYVHISKYSYLNKLYKNVVFIHAKQLKQKIYRNSLRNGLILRLCGGNNLIRRIVVDCGNDMGAWFGYFCNGRFNVLVVRFTIEHWK